MGEGFLTIVIGCYCLPTRFLSIGLPLPRLNLQGESKFSTGEIRLDLIDFEIGLVSLLVKEDEAALDFQPLLLHLALYLIQLLTYFKQ